MFDKAVFMRYENSKLCGIMLIHVDDILYAGSKDFLSSVITPLRSVFNIGTEQSECFTYIGLNLTQLSDKTIIVHQNNFANTIQKIPVTSSRDPNDLISDQERKLLRAAVGQLNWLSGVSRPDLSFDVCQLSSKISQAAVRDLIDTNKAIKKARNDQFSMKFPPLDLNALQLLAYGDASFKNLPRGGSQGGNIIFLSDGSKTCPLQWTSTRIKRVVRSTIAAEALALADACANSTYLSALVTSVLTIDVGKSIPTEVITDNQSLFDSIHSTKPVSEQELHLDISAIREKKDQSLIRVTWLSTKLNLSNVLTKKGAASAALATVLSNGYIK